MWVNISVTIIHDKLMINLTIVQTDLHDIENSTLINDIYTLIEGLGTLINVVLKNWSKII